MQLKQQNLMAIARQVSYDTKAFAIETMGFISKAKNSTLSLERSKHYALVYRLEKCLPKMI